MRLHAGARLPAARRHRDRIRHPPGPDVRAAADRGQGAGRRIAAPRRPVRGALPADRHLLHRHEAAGEAGPGAGRGPAAAAAGRAHHRPGPGGPGLDAGPGQPDRGRVRHLDPGVLAPAGRDRADLRPPGGHRRRPAAPLRLDDQLHPGQPGAAGGGGRGHGAAGSGAGRPGAAAAAGRAGAAGPDRLRRDLRRRPGRRGRSGPAAEPAGAAPAPGRGTVPGPW